MIYRILVDDRYHSAQVLGLYVLTESGLKVVARFWGAHLRLRLSPMVDKLFPDQESFMLMLGKLIGRRNLQRLAPAIIRQAGAPTERELRESRAWREGEGRGQIGAGFGHLADVMQEHRLRVPKTRNPRLRYYFTEVGWRVVGRHVAAEARRLGHNVKVIRHKNPLASQVSYRDEYQVAMLENRKPGEMHQRGRSH
jgi:hypothetical protein